MSLRASASPPSSCSGAMYWNVPRIVPREVSGWLCCSAVGMLVACETACLSGVASFARPKSRSFAPVFVSMTFAGLEVAVDEAALVRGVEGVGDLDADAQRLLGRQRPLPRPLGQRLALEELHDEVLDARLVADVVERADRWRG